MTPGKRINQEPINQRINVKIKPLVITLFLFSFLHINIDARILNDREWLTKTYLASLEGKILFVGVNYYNADYHTYVKTPETYETLDFIPERSKFGSPYKHHVGDFLTFDPGYKYDHICLFGVLGHFGEIAEGQSYNMDTENAMTQALEHATSLLKIGGTLQVGPNRISIPKFNTAYWQTRLKKYPLNKYSIISNEFGACNMLWWGKKIRD